MKEIKYLFEKVPDFKVTNLLYIKHHTYKEIVEYGEEKYITALHTLLATAHDYKSYLYDQCNVVWTDCDDTAFFYEIIRVRSYDGFIFTKPLSDYELYKDKHTGDIALLDPITEDVLTADTVKVIKEHINSMLGYMYKVHKEFPANEETKKIMIDNDRKNLQKNKDTNEPYHITVKDIIISSLCHEFEDVENHRFDEYNNKDKYGWNVDDGYNAAYNLGKYDVINTLSEKIIKELKEC